MRSWLGCIVVAGIGAALLPSRAEGIYTCVDAKGRRLTSDRPIMDCLDREQSVLGSSGQVLRKVGPSLTAQERAAEEDKARRAAEERARQLEEKRKDRALLARYPDRAAHDEERRQALAAVDEVIKIGNRRRAELQAQRKRLESELEFYQGDVRKAPPPLKRQLEDNDQLLASQARFIASQAEEKGRISAHYDEELARLKPLWATQAPVPRPPGSATRP